jgi:predicted nuclease of predicted toxin-antitoxin system
VRFLCDVHISIKVSKLIEQLGYRCDHVNNILDKGMTKDSDIIVYVDSNDIILITKDQDFRNSFLLSHKPNKLIKINLGNISNEQLLKIIEANLTKIENISREHPSFMIEINKENVWIVTK